MNRISNWLPWLFCSLVGFTLATLPLWLAGDPTWIGDYDDFAFYRPLAVTNYHTAGITLQDPASAHPSYYQSLPTMPGLLLAKSLGLGPDLVGCCWRGLGGILIGLGWFGFFRVWLTTRPSLLMAIWMMTDPGLLQSQLGYVLVRKTLAPVALDQVYTAASLAQWRILNPVQTWPWWLGFLILMGRAVLLPTRTRWLLAAAAFGLMFYIYFYFWTATIVGLGIAILADRTRRGLYLKVLLLGGLIGLPALWSSNQYKLEFGTDWMLRTDKFLPVDRFENLLIPKLSWAVWFGSTLWVWWRAQQWLWLSGFSLACLLLLNQTMITGLALESFHWNYALGPVLSGLTGLCLVDGLQLLTRHHPGRSVLGLCMIVGLIALGGTRLYVIAAGQGQQAREIQQIRMNFATLAGNWQPIPFTCIAGPDPWQYAAASRFPVRPLACYTTILSPISDLELNERLALNAWLGGLSQEEFLHRQRQTLEEAHWGAEARSETARTARLSKLADCWSRLTQDPELLCNRYGVSAVILPPETAATDRLSGWTLRNNHAGYRLYIRD